MNSGFHKELRVCDRKYFASDAEYLSFCLIFDRRGSYGIGKTGDWDKASGTAESADFGIKITSWRITLKRIRIREHQEPAVSLSNPRLSA